MVSDTDVERCVAERLDLMFDVVGPGLLEVIRASHFMTVGLIAGKGDVLIHFGNCSQVAKMPVKRRMKMSDGVSCDGGHHNVTTVARITRDDEQRSSGWKGNANRDQRPAARNGMLSSAAWLSRLRQPWFGFGSVLPQRGR